MTRDLLCYRRNPLTFRQRQTLEAIDKLTRAEGFPPSLRELGEYLGLSSSSTIFNHLQALKRKGFVDWRKGFPRTLRVIGDSAAA